MSDIGGCNSVKNISYPTNKNGQEDNPTNIDFVKKMSSMNSNAARRVHTPEAANFKKEPDIKNRMNTSDYNVANPDIELKLTFKDKKKPESKICVMKPEESISGSFSAVLENPNKAKQIIQQYNTYDKTTEEIMDKKPENKSSVHAKTKNKLKEIKKNTLFEEKKDSRQNDKKFSSYQVSKNTSFTHQNKSELAGIVDIKDEDENDNDMQNEEDDNSSRHSLAASSKAVVAQIEKITKI